MDELIKSLTRFAFAMSLFGLEQISRPVFQRRRGGASESTTAALESLSRAMSQSLGGFLAKIFRAGDDAQRDMVDSMYDALTLDAFTPRGALRTTFRALRQSAEALRLLAPGRDSSCAWQELKNKLQAFELFEHVDWVLRVGNRPALAELVEKASALDSYLAVWAYEGVGHYFAEVLAEQPETPTHLLTGPAVTALRPGSLAPLHAGMGLSFADRVLKRLQPQCSVSEVREALSNFEMLCEMNSQPGYGGAAYEALGLVCRNLYPQLLATIDEQLSALGEDKVGYFWHGVGRAVYFAPTGFMPCASSQRQYERTQTEPPHDLGRLNATAGFAWALTLVNIRHPEIIEAFLKRYGSQLCLNDAFSNGVASSVLIWHDSAPNDPHIAGLLRYRPAPDVSESWNAQVKAPCEEALRSYYEALKESGRLGEVFRYLSLRDLVGNS